MTATEPIVVERLGADVTSSALTVPRSTSERFKYARLAVTPVLIGLALLILYLWVQSQKLDSIEKRTLNWPYLSTAIEQHLRLTFIAAGITLAIAIPLGILLSRPKARLVAPFILGLANIGQAFPAIGLLVLLTVKLDVGVKVALISIVAYSVLPVLRNTIVGLQQIDPAVVEAAAGIGMRPGEILRKIELPLAVPVLMAGVRTTLVLAVGVTTLATFVDAGGLGDIIVNGLKLNRFPVQVTGAVLVMCIAFFVDWLARIAEEVANPRGL
jgi:osmoprotectant transport system permease protein